MLSKEFYLRNKEIYQIEKNKLIEHFSYVDKTYLSNINNWLFSPTNENGEPSGNFSFAFLKDSDGITKRYLRVEYNPVDSIADIGQITKLSFKDTTKSQELEIPFICVAGGGSGSDRGFDTQGQINQSGNGGNGGGIGVGTLVFKNNTRYEIIAGKGGHLDKKYLIGNLKLPGETNNELFNGVGGRSGIYYTQNEEIKPVVISKGGGSGGSNIGSSITLDTEKVRVWSSEFTKEDKFKGRTSDDKDYLKLSPYYNVTEDFDLKYTINQYNYSNYETTIAGTIPTNQETVVNPNLEFTWNLDGEVYSGGGYPGLTPKDCEINEECEGWCVSDNPARDCTQNSTRQVKPNPGMGGVGKSFSASSCADDENEKKYSYNKMRGSDGVVILYISEEYIELKQDYTKGLCDQLISSYGGSTESQSDGDKYENKIVKNGYFQDVKKSFNKNDSIDDVKPDFWTWNNKKSATFSDGIVVYKTSEFNDIYSTIGDKYIGIFSYYSETENKSSISQVISLNNIGGQYSIVVIARNGYYLQKDQTEAILDIDISDDNGKVRLTNFKGTEVNQFQLPKQTSSDEWIELKLYFTARKSTSTIKLTNVTGINDDDKQYPCVLIDNVNVYEEKIVDNNTFNETKEQELNQSSISDVNCTGEWSDCDVNCKKYWKLITPLEGNGTCLDTDNTPLYTGKSKDCNGGDGSCPKDIDCIGEFKECDEFCYKRYDVSRQPSGKGKKCLYTHNMYAFCPESECEMDDFYTNKQTECENKDDDNKDDNANTYIGIGILIGILIFFIFSSLIKGGSNDDDE